MIIFLINITIYSFKTFQIKVLNFQKMNHFTHHLTAFSQNKTLIPKNLKKYQLRLKINNIKKINHKANNKLFMMEKKFCKFKKQTIFVLTKMKKARPYSTIRKFFKMRQYFNKINKQMKIFSKNFHRTVPKFKS